MFGGLCLVVFILCTVKDSAAVRTSSETVGRQAEWRDVRSLRLGDGARVQAGPYRVQNLHKSVLGITNAMNQLQSLLAKGTTVLNRSNESWIELQKQVALFEDIYLPMKQRNDQCVAQVTAMAEMMKERLDHLSNTTSSFSLQLISLIQVGLSERLWEVTNAVTKASTQSCADVYSDQPRQVALLASGMEVLCDTQTNGGGWIIIQRRVNNQTDFYRSWRDYKEGFGTLTGNFWFGNEKVSQLTNRRRFELRVDLHFRGKDYFALYSSFSISGEEDFYRIKLGSYSGNAGDSLSFHNNQQFTTMDADHDSWPGNCAQNEHGAWWFKNCHRAHLNGEWGIAGSWKGVIWEKVTGSQSSAEKTEMKIRPV